MCCRSKHKERFIEETVQNIEAAGGLYNLEDVRVPKEQERQLVSTFYDEESEHRCLWLLTWPRRKPNLFVTLKCPRVIIRKHVPEWFNH